MSHSHAHHHDEVGGHRHGAGDAHRHGLSMPHPAQPAPWSILRMALLTRLGGALLLSAGLWAIVLLAMRPT